MVLHEHPSLSSMGGAPPQLNRACRHQARRYGGASCRLSNEQVRHIAKLARIAMSDEEIERLAPELNNILGWVEQLGEANTDGVEPLTAVIDLKLRLRDDVVNDDHVRDAILPTRRTRSMGSLLCRR